MAFETFLSELTSRISSAGDEFQSVRCWKLADLQRLSSQISERLVEEGRLKKTYRKPKVFVDMLMKSGLAHTVNVEAVQPPTLRFVTLAIGDAQAAETDAYELLQAFLPEGVISDFSAVAYHSLTTQPVTHHHVALLTEPPTKQETLQVPRPPNSTRERKEPNPLGTESFRFKGAAFYFNRRQRNLVPGVQQRWHGPQTRIRITTREQTLLDTLARPQLCGGDSVVFEAWETAASDMDQERLANYLELIDSLDLARRVGAMLDILEVEKEGPLAQTLAGWHTMLERKQEPISLLPGSHYRRINEYWAVEAP